MTDIKSGAAKTDRNNEIVRRVMEGKGEVSLQSLAEEYGLTRSRIQRIVSEKGIYMRRMRRANRKPERTECGICGLTYPKGQYAEHCRAAGHRRLRPPGEKVERNANIVRLFKDEQYNTTEIAEYYAVPQPVVTRILHRAGIRAEGRRKRKGGLADRLAAAV